MTAQADSAAAPPRPPSRIILFPGMGADPRMFAPQRAAMPHLETPDWIPHIRGESLRDYAHRFAATLDIREPAVLGGVSMGGMIALEMARVVPTRCVVLIGSCRAPGAVSPLLRLSERLARFAPDLVLDKGRVLAPLFVGTGGSISSADKRLLVQMAREQPLSFLRWAGRAVLEWPGCADPGGVPVFHIHGDRDWAIPARRTRPNQIVPRGCHVLNLSHPAEVNAFIAAAATGEGVNGGDGRF